MRETGVDQLSPAQLALPNRLLDDEVAAAVTTARAEVAVSPDGPARLPVEARVRGGFRGWQPGTVIELDNGQRWRVTDGDLTVRSIESPKVIIRPGMISGWYLRVEGQTPTAKVKPVE